MEDSGCAAEVVAFDAPGVEDFVEGNAGAASEAFLVQDFIDRVLEAEERERKEE